MRFRLALVVASLGVSAAGCATQPGSAQTRSETPDRPPVAVVRVERAPIVRTITVNGTLAAEDEVMLSLQVTGRLDELLVDLGSRVRRGDVIARLSPTDFELRVRQATAALQQARARLGLPVDGEDDDVDIDETSLVRQATAALEEARLQHDRLQTFVSRGITARAELDTASANLKIAEGRQQDAYDEIRNRQAVLAQRRSELALAEQQLADAVLRSPIDGIVRARMAVAGEFRTAGTPIVTVVRQDPLRLQLAVPERSAGDVHAGQIVRVTVQGEDQVFAGRVVRLSPAIAEGTRTLAIEASVPNPEARLRPGTFARADIVVSEAEGLVVPRSAVVVFAGVEKVMTVKDGAAHEQRITTGARVGDRIEVLDGLAEGATVIASPNGIADGAAVTIEED
jgi:RND family efflux transporter MFP subunit